eukprot:gene15660-20745_t
MTIDTLHIGVVGCSAEGAALCYRTLCVEGARYLGQPHAHPEVSVHTHSLASYVDCLDSGDIDGVAQLMLSSARKLAAAGADFLICPDNTIHQAMHRVLPQSPLPWLHIAEVVAAEAATRGHRPDQRRRRDPRRRSHRVLGHDRRQHPDRRLGLRAGKVGEQAGGRAFGSHGHSPLFLPRRSVQTGEMVDGCSETWWTHRHGGL